jgi:hypothetical protein
MRHLPAHPGAESARPLGTRKGSPTSCRQGRLQGTHAGTHAGCPYETGLIAALPPRPSSPLARDRG